MAETFPPSEEKSGQSSPSEDGQDDARRAGEQVLSLLNGVDQKKWIALLQSGALEDVMTNQVQGACSSIGGTSSIQTAGEREAGCGGRGIQIFAG